MTDTRLAMTVTSADADQLRDAARAAGMPAAVLSRTALLYVLDHLGDPDIAAMISDAAATEAERRRQAGLKGMRSRYRDPAGASK